MIKWVFYKCATLSTKLDLYQELRNEASNLKMILQKSVCAMHNYNFNLQTNKL